jgi:hypothetical protein
MVHLYAQGFQDEDLVDFSLSLTAPSSVYEKEKIELWTSKVTLAGDMVDKKLFSRYWIYENVFNMSEQDYLEEQNRIVQDAKEQFRLEQIKTEGNDPVKTGQSFGTAHDLALLYKGNGGVPKGYDEKSSEMPPKGWPGAGRPEEPGTHGTHEHPLGWDPLGNKMISENQQAVKELAKHKNLIEDLHSSKLKALNETMRSPILEENSNLLSEDNILPEE